VEEGVDEEGQEEGEEKDLLPGSVAIHLPLEVPVGGDSFWKLEVGEQGEGPGEEEAQGGKPPSHRERIA
jgi:hypothetical protein